jgi:hypothetical protein
MMNTKTSTIESNGNKRGRKSGTLNHGLVGATALLPSENERLYIEYRDRLSSSLKPVGAMEEELVERVVSLMWRLRRVSRLESEILGELSVEAELRQIDDRVDWIGRMLDADMHSPNQAFRNGGAFRERLDLLEKGLELRKRERPQTLGQGLLMENSDRSFGLLRRYESRMERSVYLALGQLERLQATRKAEEREANRVHRLPQKVTLVTNGELRECEWQPE